MNDTNREYLFQHTFRTYCPKMCSSSSEIDYNLRLLSLILIITLSSLFLFCRLDVEKLICLLLIEGFSLIYFRINLFYPYVWLSPFVLIYNISIYILNLIGVRYDVHISSILNITYCGLISLFWFSLLLIPQYSRWKSVKKMQVSNLNLKFVNLVYFCSSILLVFYIPYFIKMGFASKTEMSLSGGLMGYGIVSKAYLFLFIYLLGYKMASNTKFPLKFCIYNGILALLISLFLGERELFFSIILSSTLIYYYFKGISIKKILLGSICVVLLVPILGISKQITNLSNLSFSNLNIFEAIFQGEFLSSGRNIDILLSNSSTWDFQYGKSIFYDIGRVIIPSSIQEIANTTTWFNANYNDRAATGFGLGFSYLGEGYLQIGYLGVVLWMGLLSVILSLLYKWANKSLISFTIYIFIIPAFIYAMRGDFSYIISPLIKQACVLGILIKLITQLKNKRHYDCIFRT